MLSCVCYKMNLATSFSIRVHLRYLSNAIYGIPFVLLPISKMYTDPIRWFK